MMDSKNYLLLARTNVGYIQEKVNIKTDLETAKKTIMMIMEANNATTRGEIIEGNRDYIGDFRVKPLLRLQRNKDGNYSEEQG